MRQVRLEGTPVVETRVRIPSGDAVQRVWSVPDDGGLTLVSVTNESPLPIAVAFSRGDLLTARAPSNMPIEGIALPVGSVALPIGHHATVTVGLAHRGGRAGRLVPGVAVGRAGGARLGGRRGAGRPGRAARRLAGGDDHGRALRPRPDRAGRTGRRPGGVPAGGRRAGAHGRASRRVDAGRGHGGRGGRPGWPSTAASRACAERVGRRCGARRRGRRGRGREARACPSSTCAKCAGASWSTARCRPPRPGWIAGAPWRGTSAVWSIPRRRAVAGCCRSGCPTHGSARASKRTTCPPVTGPRPRSPCAGTASVPPCSGRRTVSWCSKPRRRAWLVDAGRRWRSRRRGPRRGAVAGAAIRPGRCDDLRQRRRWVVPMSPAPPPSPRCTGSRALRRRGRRGPVARRRDVYECVDVPAAGRVTPG